MEKEDFDKLLKISRIGLEVKDREKILKDVTEVINFFDLLDSFESGNQYAFHPVDIPEKLRDDEPKPQESDTFTKNADTYRFFVLGPKI